jgi:hypothetical protein
MKTKTKKFHDYASGATVVKSRLIPAGELYDLTRSHQVKEIDAIISPVLPREKGRTDLTQFAEAVSIISHTDDKHITLKTLWGATITVTVDTLVEVLALC